MNALLSRWRPISAILAILLSAYFGFGLVVEDANDDGQPDHITITVPESAPVQVDSDQLLEPDESREASVGTSSLPAPEVKTPDVHEDMRDETPAGVSAEDVETITGGHTAGLRAPQPVGGPERLSCRWHPVQNRSSRNGAKVKLFVLHYTVSKPGTLDVIWRLFNTPSFAASSHDLLEPSGRCEHIVAWGKKAWTQGAFNPVSESVEIMAMGTESRAWWLAQPIFKQSLLAGRVVDRLRANGLPLRRVDPSGCAVQRAGWTDHNALECGNSHHDVMPNFPYDVLAAQIRQIANPGPDLSPLTAGERAYAKRLLYARGKVRERGGCAKAPGYCRMRGEARAGLERANERLHKAGLSTERRRARHRLIHQLL